MEDYSKIKFINNKNEIEQSEVKVGQFVGNFLIALIVGLLVDIPFMIGEMVGFFVIIPLALLILICLIKIFNIRNRERIIYLSILVAVFAMFGGFYFWMGRGNGTEMSGLLFIVGLVPAIIIGIFFGISISNKIVIKIEDVEQKNKNKISLKYAIYFGLLFFLIYDISSLMFLPVYITIFKSSFSNFVLTRYIGDIVVFIFGYNFGKFIFKYLEKMTSFTEIYRKIIGISFWKLSWLLLVLIVLCVLNFYAYHAAIYILLALLIIIGILSFLFFVSANFLDNLVRKTFILLIIGLILTQLIVYFY